MTDVFSRLPVAGQNWVHTKTGKLYTIIGSSYNSLTDHVDVVYEPRYACQFHRFNRQMVGHEKAFLSKNEDGTPRFELVKDTVTQDQ
jgi:hypothetical protein